MLDQRGVVGRLMMTCCVWLLGLTGVQAAAPMHKTQAPGYYRLMIGAFEVTALNDGTDKLPSALFTNVTSEQVRRALRRAHLADPVEISINAFLVNTGKKLILIDTGAGHYLGPELGGLLSNLRASGYQPEQVDEIYLTHLHPDHVGGLLSGDQAAFPNAIVRVAESEAGFWLDSSRAETAPADLKQRMQQARDAVAPYVKAGKFMTFSDEASLAPGIRAIASPGHTPGHTSYVVESQGQKLLIWGDIVHVGALQLADPNVGLKFDSDGAAAILQRKKALTDAAEGRYWVAGAHLSFPGIGHVNVAGSGYAWIPANFSTLH